MTARIRPIPIHCRPIDGESLTSWLHAYAQRLSISPSDFYRLSGVTSGQPSRNKRRPDHAVLLRPAEANALTTATGLPATQLHAMTLTGWDRTLLDIDRDTLRVRPVAAWRPAVHVRACPQCLAETDGRWQLAWYLPWSLVCIRHRLLLAKRCPRCATPFARRIRATRLITHPATCNAPLDTSAYGTRCGQDLRDIATPTLSPDDPVVDAQRWLDNGIQAARNADTAQAETSRAAFEAVAALARRIHLHRTHIDPDDDLIPSSDEAAAVTAAVQLWRTDDPRQRSAAYRNLLNADRTRGVAVGPNLIHSEWKTTPRLRDDLILAIAPDMTRVARLRWRTPTGKPNKPQLTAQGIADRARHIPQALWPDLAAHLMPPTATQIEKHQTAFAVALLLPGAANPTIDAAEQHLRLRSQAGLGYALNTLEQHYGPEGLNLLCWLADHLDHDTPPIDYARRRTLPVHQLLTRAQWADIANDTGIPPGHDRQHLHAVQRLYELLTGGNLTHAPDPLRIADHRQRADYATFVHKLPTPAWGALEAHAKAVLAELGIVEPVTWQPAFDDTLLTGLLPRNHPLLRDIHNWGKPTNDDPARTATSSTSSQRPNWRVHQDAVHTLTPDVLRPLLADGTSLRDIGKLTGYSRQAVTRRIHALGLTRVPAPERIDPAWLRRRYLTDRRTIPQIAAETGMSATAVARRLRRHEIPIRLRGTPSHAAAVASPDTNLPPLLRRILTVGGPATREHLVRFAQFGGHATLRDAAAHIGTKQSVLTAQLARLEAAAGKPLLHRAYRGRPMRYTAPGAALAQTAREHLPPQ